MKSKGSISKKSSASVPVLTSVATFSAQHLLLLPTLQMGNGYGKDLKDLFFGRASKVDGSGSDQCATTAKLRMWWEAKPDLTFVIFLPSGEAWWEPGTDGPGRIPPGWSSWRRPFFYIQEICRASYPYTAAATGTTRNEGLGLQAQVHETLAFNRLVASEQSLCQKSATVNLLYEAESVRSSYENSSNDCVGLGSSFDVQ